MKRIMVLLMLLAALTVYAADKPEWYTDPASVYPHNRYLTALGDGDTVSQAENMAVRGISKIINTTIKVDEEMKDSYSEMMKDDQIASGYSTELKKVVQIHSESDLFNVQFGERFTDETGRICTIAIIDRAKTGSILDERIRRIAEQVRDYIDSAGATQDPVRRCAYYTAANELNNVLLVMHSQLEVISPSHAGMVELGYNPQLVQSRWADSRQAITFYIVVDYDDENAVTNALREAFTGMGFSESKDATLLVNGKVEMDAIKFRDDMKTVDWKINIMVKNINGDTIVSYSKNDRESSVTWERAKSRAYRQINKLLAKNVMKKVESYFTQYIAK